jgi:hypothetical protein
LHVRYRHALGKRRTHENYTPKNLRLKLSYNIINVNEIILTR